MKPIPIEEARALIRTHVAPLAPHDVGLADARGHVLAADAVARVDLPPFRQSAMDGWAARAASLSAGPRVAGTVSAGDAPGALGADTCVRIMTGAPIPEGADVVVRKEDAEVRDGRLFLTAPAPSVGADIRERGEVVSTGGLLAGAGTRLTSGAVASLAAAGVTEVRVRPRPRVSVVVTGDELAAEAVSRVPDANTPQVVAFFEALGVDVSVARVGDDRAATAKRIDVAARGADLVVTTGGVSVGDHDHVLPASQSVGFEQVFWRVAQRPGKPLYFATRDGVPLLGLPGNPAAVWVQLQTQVALALSCLEGAPQPSFRRARVDADVPASEWADLWVRCAVDWRNGASLRPLSGQASHMLVNLPDAAALALVRAGTPLRAGDVVEWLPVVA